ILVHFTVAWCAPSKFIAGFFEQLSPKYPGILFLSVDVDELKRITEKLDVNIRVKPVAKKASDHSFTKNLYGLRTGDLGQLGISASKENRLRSRWMPILLEDVLFLCSVGCINDELILLDWVWWIFE
ncbi:hypothetical protein KI387_004138, partial [Taxus chinensis]